MVDMTLGTMSAEEFHALCDAHDAADPEIVASKARAAALLASIRANSPMSMGRRAWDAAHAAPREAAAMQRLDSRRAVVQTAVVEFTPPAMPAATERQVAYIASLAAERQVTEAQRQRAAGAAKLSRAAASALITELQGAPRQDRQDDRQTASAAPKPPTVPDGRYALQGDDGVWKFYRVKAGSWKWAGYHFLSVLASSTEHPIRNRATRDAILSRIAADPRAAMVAYGRELGECGKCSRPLTNPESIAAGIGPICAEALGW